MIDPSVLFGAFAEPTRLRILNLLLAQKEICVCDPCAVPSESQPKVSRHLAVLRRAGLVEVRREGRWKHDSLAQVPSSLQRTHPRCVESCLREVDPLRRDRSRLRALEPRLRCA